MAGDERLHTSISDIDTMASDPKKLLKKHQQLTQSDHMKVVSHVQREDNDWFLHTLMLEDIDTPFKFRRQQQYQNLKGQRVNLTYYRDTESIAGMDFEVMRIVRIKVA
ncbi:Uncharacterised protein [BD1-7 clade bacterium]|uniref:Uncharacterized protein n=1 Tax=BD1-7 clade bacterium TaxID=2029982 RepID=A0A5S9N059_9GAMM|nr:Uncharacterised protein [BD1-7 clade bacterium]CAA0082834.1 Uncharacterised protein [BD1-7 clade bacterium]